MSALADLSVPLAVLAIVLALVAPVPPLLMDMLLVSDITISVIVLMVAMYVARPSEFSVFPATLLLLTLYRLALNVSSARLILLHGNTGTRAAGAVIEAFGSFVVGGNYIVGAVIFLVLLAIQYVVINHGAVRISEVSARFTLDALPGKQMSIDSDLNAGLIGEAEARERRKTLAAEAEFYGAMDGASRFMQRDAVATILIAGINIIAGLLIGVLQHGMELPRAAATYTVLTIGDGLVTVIPALMISISGGLVLARAGSGARLGVEFRRQIFGAAEPLLLASGVLLALAALPGLPKTPFFLLGAVVGAAAWRMRDRSPAKPAPAPAIPPRENLDALLRVDPLAMEVGLGLLPLVEGGADSPLLRRIAGVRRQLASDLGCVLPPVRVADSLALRPREYVVLLQGAEIARYEMPPGRVLAIPAGQPTMAIAGDAAREPAFGTPAIWIPVEQSEQAGSGGYTVAEPLTVIATHLAELARQHMYELFCRQDARRLLDRIAADHPRLVEELVPKLLPLGVVQRVLQNLLRERVSIRDGASILEALSDAAAATRNPVLLTEAVRRRIRRMVVRPYLDGKGELPAYLVSPQIERLVEAAVEHGEQESHLALAPQAVRELQQKFGKHMGAPPVSTVAVTSGGARHFLRWMLESTCRRLFFLSHGEIPEGVEVVSLGVID